MTNANQPALIQISSFGPSNFVHIERPCSHSELLTAKALAMAGVARAEGGRSREADVPPRVRRAGRAVVSIRWANKL